MADQKPWKNKTYLRRAAYAVLALALVIAVGLGWVTPEQADAWKVAVERVIDTVLLPLAALGLAVASKKTTIGSDDPSTVEDVERARNEGRDEGRDEAMRDVRRVVSQKVQSTPTPRQTVQEPDPAPAPATGVSLPTYNGPTSH